MEGHEQDFASWLRERLEERGLGVRTLARIIVAREREHGRTARLESERNALHRYLSGKIRPNPKSAQKIADALGIAYEDVPTPKEAARKTGGPFRGSAGGAGPSGETRGRGRAFEVGRWFKRFYEVAS